MKLQRCLNQLLTIPPLPTTADTTKRTPVFKFTTGMTHSNEVFFGRMQEEETREGTGLKGL